ncbi:MAG: glutamine synthetase adenylyltransferase [Anaerolineae bacterium]|nr:glutamine synthetase adenylyltransferase [Anaerolineae bacterium]
MTTVISQRSRDLLLKEELGSEEIQRLLAPVGFADWQTAYRRLQQISPEAEARLILADSLPHLLTALSDAASPDNVLVNFSRFAHSVTSQVDLFHQFIRTPRMLEILITLSAGSQFLTEILLRSPEYFDRFADHHRLTRIKSAWQYDQSARAAVIPLLRLSTQDPAEPAPLLDALRRFQRWELLRIGVSDLLDSFDLTTVTIQLSHLANSLVRVCLAIAARQANIKADDFTVIALGKLGGQELNYSSDIDLLFLCRKNPAAYRRLGQNLIDALARMTPEGFLYRVDMRLRPWGRDGMLVSTIQAHLNYMQKNARLWEKQALLKARVIAGNQELGEEFLHRVQPLIFAADDETVQAEVKALKQRIEDRLRQKGCEWGEVKLGQGSIRDIEFVTQYLQLLHGDQQPDVRSPNTLEALRRLFTAHLLPADEYRVLADGYIFLRTIEHHLQLKHYRQTHTLPNDPNAIRQLARRLGFQGSEAGENLIARYQQHSTVIRLVYQRHLGGKHQSIAATTQANEPILRSPSLIPHLVRMPPAYVATFSDAVIEHHVSLVEQLSAAQPIKVEAEPLDNGYWQVTIVGYDYLGELSLICGLLFVHGFDIINGHVFSYGPRPPAPGEASVAHRSGRWRHGIDQTTHKNSQRKIVDVFTVYPALRQVESESWTRYAEDLTRLVGYLRHSEQRKAQGELAKQVAVALRDISGPATTLYPVDIEIDNDASDRHTVLRIQSLDTIGFLYEFTNALALNGINIRRMEVASEGNRVCDTLYVTDIQRRKITAPEKQRELRVATALIKHFTHLLPGTPDPERALLHFREFVGQLFTRPNWPDELTSLEQPEVLTTLARLLGVSDFLWKDFLRMQHANLFPVVKDVDALATAKSKTELQAELTAILQALPDKEAKTEALNAFKDREMFRIDMRHIQDQISEFGQFSDELTDLAEVVVETAYCLCLAELQAIHGSPRLANGRACPMSVCALGKCGGRELGFASDIELMFVFAGNGRTTGPEVITTAEFYDKLVRWINRTMQTRREGIFEVDLRLRPYGKAGNMAVSLESFGRYFAPGGDAWAYERQALVKLRPIAGDEKLGQKIVKLRDEFIYTSQPFDVAAMRAMRERQVRHLVTAGTINAKFSPGGLVDLEYLVQGLQITYGHQNPRLRLTNIGEAMAMLAKSGLLSANDYLPLRKAHVFLRQLIDALRMVRGNAKDLTVPPPDSEEFAFLARRLNYGDNLAQLQNDLSHHITCVQEISQRILG